MIPDRYRRGDYDRARQEEMMNRVDGVIDDTVRDGRRGTDQIRGMLEGSGPSAYRDWHEQLMNRIGRSDPDRRPGPAEEPIRDPMATFAEINEYLEDATVGFDAMRCRPRDLP
jgi:hypothetical protein